MTGRCPSASAPMPLLLGVALLVMAATAGAQVLNLGACRNYQGATSFDDAYIAKLAAATDGYALLLTSDRPRTSNCQRLTLYGNGTFLFSYNDDYNRLRNHSDTYTTMPSSNTGPGYIQLRMPVALFGATLTGELRLNVLVAEDDYLVVVSCWEPLPFLRSEYVHAFVPVDKVNTIVPTELQSALIAMGVSSSSQMREVYQGCFANTRFFLDTEEKADLYNFFVKLGLAPPIPIRRLHEVRAGNAAQFYNAPPSFVAHYPQYHFATGPVNSVASFPYPASPSVNGFVSTAGQGHSFVYNAPLPSSSQMPPTIVGFIPPQSGFGPVSSHVNYGSQSFSSPDFLRNSPSVSHDSLGVIQSSQGFDNYNSPVVSYSSVGSTNTPSFIHSPPVASYSSASFG